MSRHWRWASLVVLAAVLAATHAAGRAKPVAVGDRVPDFVLQDQQGKPFKLSAALEGRKLVVLAFYLKADSPG